MGGAMCSSCKGPALTLRSRLSGISVRRREGVNARPSAPAALACSMMGPAHASESMRDGSAAASVGGADVSTVG